MQLPFCTSSSQSVFLVVRLSESVYDSPGMLYNIKDIIYRRNRINRQGETNVRNRGDLRNTA